jgi:cation diffusion facilitator family transporter
VVVRPCEFESRLGHFGSQYTSLSHSHTSHTHQAEALKAAWISIVVTLLLVGLKLFAGYLSGSLALLSLASESVLDLFTVLLSLIAVRVAYLPADEDHLYGHGKFDVLVSLFQSIMLLGVSVWIFYEAVTRILDPNAHQIIVDWFTFVVLVGSFILDGWRSYRLHHTGKAAGSKALQTDALHFLVDGLGTVVVLLGIILYKFAAISSADNYAALGVSAFVVYLSIRQGKDAIDGLTDRLASSDEYKQIAMALSKTEAVLGTRQLRMRRSGPALFVEGGIEINRVLPFASVEHILSVCSEIIKADFPDAEVNFYPIAIKTEGESLFETIKLISSEYGVLPHNIELAKNEAGELSLDLHLEFKPHISLEEAHSLSTIIEDRISEEIPSIRQIVVHLEEERSDVVLQTVHRIDISSYLDPIVLEQFIKTNFLWVTKINDIELLKNETTGDLKLTAIIQLGDNLSLYDAHEVSTAIEKGIREKYPVINRIVIHVEPA